MLTKFLTAALLPALTLAQAQSYSITVGGQVTVIALPPFSGDAPAPAPTSAPEAPVSQSGQTIPVSVGGQVTSVVLPYFDGQSTVTAAVTSVESAVSSASSQASSLTSAIDSGTSSSQCCHTFYAC